jgi:hypothetical protein
MSQNLENNIDIKTDIGPSVGNYNNTAHNLFFGKVTHFFSVFFTSILFILLVIFITSTFNRKELIFDSNTGSALVITKHFWGFKTSHKRFIYDYKEKFWLKLEKGKLIKVDAQLEL